MFRSPFRRPRRSLLLICLLGALLLVAALGIEAITASRAQRDAVEGVLHDYAGLAAEQYARNVNVMMDYEWLWPTLRILPDSDPHALAADTEIEAQRGAYSLGDLVNGVFWFEPTGGEARYRSLAEQPAANHEPGSTTASHTGQPPSPEDLDSRVGGRSLDELRELVVADARRRWQDDWLYAVFVPPAGHPRDLIAYRIVEDDAGNRRFLGVVADAARMTAAFERAVVLYELLPPTITDGVGDGELVRIGVVDTAGELLFARGPADPRALAANADLMTLVSGLGVFASIPPSSAEQLVVGGLPYSRLPTIIAMLSLTAGLFGAGLMLLRRERELVALREQFIAGASHELRTPLSQIRMFAETLRLHRVRSSEEGRRSLEIIDREARRLSLLVENLLRFSRPADAQRRFVPQEVDVSSVVRDVVEGFVPIAAGKGVTVQVEDAPVSTRADRDMLRQILLNLLDNAVKYGPEQQTVTVQVGVDEGAAAVSVIDEGPGIPAAERNLVWQRFWRGSATDGITGTGIGLALVAELVALHDGSVRIDAGPTGGARVQIRLPLTGD